MSKAVSLVPGDMIGILGGGQLGRLLALKCAKLGLKTHIYAPEEDSPAFEAASAFTCAAYEDWESLAAFARSVMVVTYEFENVPAACANFLQQNVSVFPPPSALAIAQDRGVEKQFIAKRQLPLAPFRLIDSLADLETALGELGTPAILKTRQFGYDGKGQVKITSPAEADVSWNELSGMPCVLEAFIALAKEISVIAVRGQGSEIETYDVTENVHRDHILHTSTVPASVSVTTASEARGMAEKLVAALDYVGVLGVEFFVDKTGGLLVNEIAPRVHNSGHWTLDACACCQFENHIRAIAGWPLGKAGRHSDAVMTNLIGDEAENWQEVLQNSDNLWLYGKGEARPGRKMGHITRLSPR